MRLWNAAKIAVFFSTSTLGTSAASLTFLSPKAPLKGGWLNYTQGQRVNISWTSDFENITLRLVEGPFKNGSYLQENLYVNASRGDGTTLWEAKAIANTSVSNDFHFELVNGRNASCANCTVDGPGFHIGSKSSSISPTVATMIPTASSTTLPPVAATSVGSSDTGSARARQQLNLDLGLGLGLGVGGAAILLLLGGIAVLIRRRRRRGERSLGSSRHPVVGGAVETAEVNLGGRNGRHSGQSASSRTSFYEFDFERQPDRSWDALPLAGTAFDATARPPGRTWDVEREQNLASSRGLGLGTIGEGPADWPLART